MLRIANSSVNSDNRAEGKEPSAKCVQDSIIEEPMVIQQEPGGVEAFMHSMSVDEKSEMTLQVIWNSAEIILQSFDRLSHLALIKHPFVNNPRQ